MRSASICNITTPYLFGAVTDLAAQRADLVNLGVGDTSLPLADCVVEAIQQHAASSIGYGPERGLPALREAIAATFYPMRHPDEIFISDGAKTDIGRIQALFDPATTLAIQDPTYPTYAEAALLSGKTNIVTIACPPNYQFFPEMLPKVDVMICCSPNNPTGHAFTTQQLTTLIEHARAHRMILIIDTAYSGFIQDPEIPRTAYDIPGAEEVVIEINSFSKIAGFTGLRLSWTVVPKAVRFKDKHPVHPDWCRIIATYYNGTSRLIQHAGIAALTPPGLAASAHQVTTYLKRAKRLKEGLSPYFPTIYGGVHSPYLWIPTTKETFDRLGIVTIPGEGFGAGGKGYVRLSAFAQDTFIEEAIKRCSQLPTLSSI